MAQVAAFAGKTLEEIEEDFIGFGLAGDFVEAGNAALRQNQAVAVAQDDIRLHRPELVLFEHQLAQVVVGLFAGFNLDAFEVEARAHGVVPLSGS